MGRIVWLASYPRSGNTWLRLFLHALTKGRYRGPGLPQLETFAPNEASPRFYEPALGKPADRATPAEFAAARETAQMLAAASSENGLLMKTHHQAGYHLGHPTVNLTATAGAVYLVRNPLDVALSLSAFLDIDLAATADIMRPGSRYLFEPRDASYYYIGSWADHVESWTWPRNPKVLVVRYEDMLQSPSETFTSIARFLKFPTGQAAVSDALDEVNFDDLRRREARHGLVEFSEPHASYFREGRSGSWREQIDTATIRAICEGTVPLLRRFGYDDVIDAMN